MQLNIFAIFVLIKNHFNIRDMLENISAPKRLDQTKEKISQTSINTMKNHQKNERHLKLLTVLAWGQNNGLVN